MLATWASVDDALEALAVLLQARKPHSLRLLGADVLHAGVRSFDCFAVCWHNSSRGLRTIAGAYRFILVVCRAQRVHDLGLNVEKDANQHFFCMLCSGSSIWLSSSLH